ncbi:MAG: HlyC/CorC family transporter [Clostridia bacterium]|nr:HlyC/CorC family transporter [Clostridia bacterium]
MLIAIILQIVLIFLNAVFASAEIAVLSTNTAKLEKLSEEGNKKAKRLLVLTANSSKFLSTIQVAITLAGLLGSAYAADNFAEPLVGLLISLGITLSEATLKSICVLLITILLSFFSIVFGELVPKRIAMKHAEKMALGLSGILTFVSTFFAPFVWILTKSTNGILRLFRIDPNEEEEAPTEEEILMMVDSGSEGGTIDSEENEMIQNVFAFDDISISEVCTHRLDVAMLSRKDSLDDWKKTIMETGHSYYPIYNENADDIIGVLNMKKLCLSEYTTVDEVIENIVVKPYLVPENMKADALLRNMKKTRNYFAVVIDEYGGTSGVITLQNLLEILVGDINEAEEDVKEEIIRTSENTWHIMGFAPIDKVKEALSLQFDHEECETFAGYILGLHGTIPDDGTEFDIETDLLHIHVEHVEEHRIILTRVSKKEQALS